MLTSFLEHVRNYNSVDSIKERDEDYHDEPPLCLEQWPRKIKSTQYDHLSYIFFKLKLFPCSYVRSFIFRQYVA